MLKRFLPCLLFFLLQALHAQTATPTKICGDPNPSEWMTPATLAQHPELSAVTGISVDMMRAVFNVVGKDVIFTADLPWKRCLNEVQNGNIDFAMGAYYDQERAKTFDYSIHYNTLTPQIFYLSSNPVTAASLNELKRYKGCGNYGSSYEHYGLNAAQLDLGAGYDSMIRKLRAKRCDYFVEELEIIASFKMFGKDILSEPDIAHSNAPWAVAPSRYVITAKGKNTKLLEQINHALEGLIKSGKAAEIWKTIIATIPYKP